MKPSKLMLISIFITAAILAVVGGVVSVAAAKNASTSQVPSAETLQAYQQREAEYNQLIQQANQQLEQANRELQVMQEQVGAAPVGAIPASAAQAAPAQPAGAAPAISAEQAVELAKQAVPPGQTLQKTPELVEMEGKMAYEVAFGLGTVYIDAVSGEVLFNGTAPQEISADQAAQVAADYLHIEGIYQVDTIQFRGAELYRVIFKNGVMAYLDKTGQITYVLQPSPRVSVQQSSSGGSGGSSITDDSGGRYEDEHEDEHEEEHETEHENEHD